MKLCAHCRAMPNDPVVMTHPVLNAVASRHNKTPAQVARRFYLYRSVHLGDQCTALALYHSVLFPYCFAFEIYIQIIQGLF